MKIVTVKFQFDDVTYKSFEKLAKKLNIPIEELIANFFEEGVSLMWEAFEYEAAKSNDTN